MSHVAQGKPLITDIAALAAAAAKLGGELVEQTTYKWFGRSVGDYPVPDGWTVEEMGRNAKYVIRLTPEKKAELSAPNAYEIGVIEDKSKPGQYSLAYDFFCGGFGLDKAFGSPVQNADGTTTYLPELQRRYHMECDVRAAKSAGDSIRFMTMREARELYPSVFGTKQQATDNDTIVSVVDTAIRIGR